MNSHFRSSNGTPKGLICADGTQVKPLQTRPGFLPTPSGRRFQVRAGTGEQPNFLIGDAYREPASSRFVEELLLQRDYIID